MEKFIKFIGAVTVALAVILILAWPVMLLWNELMPTIFGLIEIDFWQSLGLLILSNMLFKSNNNE